MTDKTIIHLQSDSTTVIVGPRVTQVIAGAPIGPPGANGTGGGGSALTVQVDDATIDASITTLDFRGADFDVTEAPEDEANVALSSTSVVSGSYGTQSSVVRVRFDAKGRATSASEVAIAVSESAVTGLTTDLAGKIASGSAVVGPDLAGNFPAIFLSSTSVVSGTYGTQSAVARVTFDAKGRATSASEVAIAISESAVTGLVTDLAAKIASGSAVVGPDLAGNFPAIFLSSTSVVSGTYGTQSAVARVTFDAKGRATSASEVAIALSESAVTGLVTDLSAKLVKASNLSDVSSAPTSRYNLHDQVLAAAQVVATRNVSLTGEQTIDGYSIVSGEVALLAGQTDRRQNGPWMVNGGAWTRPNDYPAGGTVRSRLIQISNGTVGGNTVWGMATSASLTVDTSSSSWAMPSPGIHGWTLYAGAVPTTGYIESPKFSIVFAGVDLTGILEQGMRAWIEQGTDKRFIIDSVSFSTDTTVILYGGTANTLVASGTTAITAFRYSRAKAPSGFLPRRALWRNQLLRDDQNRLQANPTKDTLYNPNSVSVDVPAGYWRLYFRGESRARTSASAVLCAASVFLSTSPVSSSDSTGQSLNSDSVNRSVVAGVAGTLESRTMFGQSLDLIMSTKTTLYVVTVTNQESHSSIGTVGNDTPTVVEVESAWL